MSFGGKLPQKGSETGEDRAIAWVPFVEWVRDAEMYQGLVELKRKQRLVQFRKEETKEVSERPRWEPGQWAPPILCDKIT